MALQFARKSQKVKVIRMLILTLLLSLHLPFFNLEAGVLITTVVML